MSPFLCFSCRTADVSPEVWANAGWICACIESSRASGFSHDQIQRLHRLPRPHCQYSTHFTLKLVSFVTRGKVKGSRVSNTSITSACSYSLVPLTLLQSHKSPCPFPKLSLGWGSRLASGKKENTPVFFQQKNPSKTSQLPTAAMWRQMGSLAEEAQLCRLAGHWSSQRTDVPRQLEGLSPSYRASRSRGEFVGGEGEGFIAEVGVEHFLEDNAAVGKQQSGHGERMKFASLLRLLLKLASLSTNRS